MQIAGSNKLKKFVKAHHQAKAPAENWLRHMQESAFRTPAELQVCFPQADNTGVALIFNLGPYRLAAKVDYGRGIVNITWVGTHDEYDKLNRDRKRRGNKW